MPKLIDHLGERSNDWLAYDGDAHAIPPGAKVLLPLTEFREFAGTWRNHAAAIGVVLSPSDDPAMIAQEFDKLQLIAIDFPTFTDGRGYSLAKRLRDHYGWRGELRAIGDIARDQIYLLWRSGFDTFALRDDQSASDAIIATRDFSAAYQPAGSRSGGSVSSRAFA